MEARVWQAFTSLTAPATERLTFFECLGAKRKSEEECGDRYRNSRLAQGMRGHIHKLKIIFNGIEVLKIIGRVSAPKICPDVALVTGGRLCSNSQNTHGPVAQR